MTARTVHKYEGHNICERCHDNIYKTKVSRKSSYFYNEVT